MSFSDIRPEFNVITDEELKSKFQEGLPVYFDTNVIRDLWRLHSAPRKSVMELIGDLSERVYLPFQTQVELKSQAFRTSLLNAIPRPSTNKIEGLISSARSKLEEEIGFIRPLPGAIGGSEEDVAQILDEVAEKFGAFLDWFNDVDGRVRQLLGAPIDVGAIRSGARNHDLLDELGETFQTDHFMSEPAPSTRDAWTVEYDQRINKDEPVGPGLTDVGKATVEKSAGDYYMWQEMLNHCVENGFSKGFFFVTQEKKKDLWEQKQDDEAVRRIDPRIQKESIDTTGGPMIVIDLEHFLRLAAPQESADMYSSIARDAVSESDEWTYEAYSSLLNLLAERGRTVQQEVIMEAAKRGGYITREEIGNILGWEDGAKNYLTRFRMPADSVKNILVDMKLLPDSASDPLVAVYRGPGEAVGYRVPPEFSDFCETSESVAG
ncbi:PIN-like domain-containing protein [Corynebacterium sp. P3-F1]|uniref:PIN-like domain-containing protein n=1 Tax=Corynebacterium sp. P3-F1 TaxID=3059080 RepID=UPI00265D584B|nr:PIN-like domain-containing protein [Corynebacterium sp. P3-F1]WKK61333.1 PIN-like domain-containing protein [Corynebacterium sp. P3-F1]